MAKTKLTKDEVKHIAKLAQLDLSEKEIEKYQRQLSEILAYAGKLDKVKTAKVEPTSQVTGLENVFQEDKPALSLPPEEVLSGAKEKQNGYFKTKGVFEEK